MVHVVGAGRPSAKRPQLPLPPIEKHHDGLVDSPLPRLGGLGSVDLLDMEALQAVGQCVEECSSRLVRLQRSSEIRRHVDERGASRPP